MKAIRLRRFGGADGLRCDDGPRLRPLKMKHSFASPLRGLFLQAGSCSERLLGTIEILTSELLWSPSQPLRLFGSRRARSRVAIASERDCCRFRRSSLPY